MTTDLMPLVEWWYGGAWVMVLPIAVPAFIVLVILNVRRYKRDRRKNQGRDQS